MLHGMAEAGMAKLMSEGPPPAGSRLDPAEAFALLSRAIRLTLVLEGKIEDELGALKAGTLVPAAWSPVAPRKVANGQIDKEQADDRIEPPRDDLHEHERLTESENYDAFLALPFEEAVGRIRKAFGLLPDWGLRAEHDAPPPADPPPGRPQRAWFPAPEPIEASREAEECVRETSESRPPGMIRAP